MLGGQELHRFVVIGAPGQGKSTVLNEFAGGDDIFRTSTGAQSCTKAGGEWEARNTQIIHISDGMKRHSLQLVDTPGFPDPDPAAAARFYDHVVQKCNERISGVVFVCKPERKQRDVLAKYACLLREFVNLQAPLIVLMNGTEVAQKKRETREHFDARRKKGLADFREVAEGILEATGLHAREILVSYCIDDLEDIGKDIARIFSARKPVASNLLTYARVAEQMKSCVDAHSTAALEMKHADQKVAKCRQDIASLEEEIGSLRSWQKGTCWIPFAGVVTVMVLASKIDAKRERITELHAQMAKAQQAKHEVGDVAAMERKARESQARCQELAKYLE